MPKINNDAGKVLVWYTETPLEAGFNGQQWLEQKKDKIKYGIGQLEQDTRQSTGTSSSISSYTTAEAQLVEAEHRRTGTLRACTWYRWSRTRHTARKEDTRIDGPWEIGICSTQGKQTGLDEATAMVASGTPLVEVARTFPWYGLGTARG